MLAQSLSRPASHYVLGKIFTVNLLLVFSFSDHMTMNAATGVCYVSDATALHLIRLDWTLQIYFTFVYISFVSPPPFHN